MHVWIEILMNKIIFILNLIPIKKIVIERFKLDERLGLNLWVLFFQINENRKHFREMLIINKWQIVKCT